MWGANVERRASEMGRICLGASGLGHIANPITWFLTPPDSYWFVKADQVREHNNLRGIWIVQSYRVNFDDGQSASLSLIDPIKGRWAYLGDVEADSKQKITQNFDTPDWTSIKELPKDVWIRNAIDWINAGKPRETSYCS